MAYRTDNGFERFPQENTNDFNTRVSAHQMRLNTIVERLTSWWFIGGVVLATFGAGAGAMHFSENLQTKQEAKKHDKKVNKALEDMNKEVQTHGVLLQYVIDTVPPMVNRLESRVWQNTRDTKGALKAGPAPPPPPPPPRVILPELKLDLEEDTAPEEK